MTKEDFWFQYKIMLRKDKDVFLKAIKDGIISKYSVNSKGRCSYYINNIYGEFILTSPNVPKFVDEKYFNEYKVGICSFDDLIEWIINSTKDPNIISEVNLLKELRTKESFNRLKFIANKLNISTSSKSKCRSFSKEQFMDIINGISEETSYSDYHYIYKLVKKSKVCPLEYIKILEDIGEKFKINKPKSSYFIMPYEEAKDVSLNQLNIFENPIVLNETNVLDMISKKSIVWDIYSEQTNEVIYVGERSIGILELNALILYINNDKIGTIKRRKEEYGYKSEYSKRIEEIWSYEKFVVRLIATGKQGASLSVKVFESIWNQECNDRKGALVKQ